MKTLLKVLALLVALPVVGIVILALLVHEPLPTTDELRQDFVANRAAWDARVDAIRDTLARGETFPHQPDEVLGYRTFSAAGEPFRVRFYTTTSGVGVGAYGTGLAYLEEAPEGTYPSLEAMMPDAQAVEGFEGYGHLDGAWYYFLWEAD